MTTFGTLLKRHRVAVGLTQEQLAEAARMSTRAISDLERGVRRSPYRDTVQRLGDVLDLTVEDRAALEESARRLRARPQEPETTLPVGGYLGALPERPLVAREPEMYQLRAAIARAFGDSTRLVVLAGEAGVGKTRVAQELILQLGQSSIQVATGRCYESRRAVPYYPFLEVMSTLFGASSQELRNRAARRWPYLTHLLPASVTNQIPPHRTAPDEQERLFWSVSGFLHSLAAVAPVAIVIDDLHWADGASLELLKHVVRHTARARILLAGTYRDTELGAQHPLGSALQDLAREQLVEKVPVRRLTREGTAAFVAELTGHETDLAELVHRQTDGNPFFIRELVHSLSLDEVTIETDRSYLVDPFCVPESIRAVVGQRLARLPRPAQDVLASASVLGETFCFGDLVGMGGHPAAEVECALDDAELDGLVRELSPDAYTFDHALIQQTLYGELPARRRRRLHAEAARALEQAGAEREDRVVELLRHWAEAGEVEKALPYALEAGARAESLYALREAIAHYRTACDLAQDIPEPEKRNRAEAESLTRLGAALFRIEAYAEAEAVVSRALDGFRAVDDATGLAEALSQLANVYSHVGREDDAIALLEHEAPLLTAHGAPEALCQVMASLSTLYFCVGRYEEEYVAAEQASELAQGLLDNRLITIAAHARALALTVRGSSAAARETLEGVMGHAEAAGDPLLLSHSLTVLSEQYRLAGRLPEAESLRRRILASRDLAGSPHQLEFARANLAELLIFSGNWKEARSLLEEQAEATKAAGSGVADLQTLANLGMLSLAEGKHDEAITQAQAALVQIETRHDPIAQRAIQSCLAEIALLDGRPGDALARVQPLLTHGRHSELMMTPALMIQAWAVLEVGDVPRAEQLARSAERTALGSGDRLNRVDVLRVLGMALARSQRPAEAVSVLEDAEREAAGMPYPYARARILHELGIVYLKTQDGRRARKSLDGALSVALQLGAGRVAAQARSALARLRAPAA